MDMLSLHSSAANGDATKARRRPDPVALMDCALFRELDIAERSRLLAHARIREVAAGDASFLAGMAQNGLMVVLGGNVRISSRSSQGKEILLAIVQPGEIFAEMVLLDGKERSADAHAMTNCSIATLARG